MEEKETKDNVEKIEKIDKKENNLKKYKSIISTIKNMDKTDGEGNPWYADDYNCPGYEELKKMFPNVSFKKEDLFKLQKIWNEKDKNDNTIYNLEDFKYGHSFYESHGHSKTKEEDEQYNNAKAKKGELDSKWDNAINSFFTTCEILNGDRDLNSCDIEKDAFQPICDYKLELRPKNPFYSNYFNTYQKYNEAKSNNEKLIHSNMVIERKLNEKVNENKELTIANQELTQENTTLKANVSKLRKMLDKTLEFCNKVKESKLGRLFFRKHLKALPSAQIENEKESNVEYNFRDNFKDKVEVKFEVKTEEKNKMKGKEKEKELER
ncbi:MAG: hypothetical protein IKN65_07085 [Clostridia bacterium]|nr:hypothetical protein [Clostridia bacterium]